MKGIPEQNKSYGIIYLSKDDAQDHKLEFATQRDRVAMNKPTQSATSTFGISSKPHPSSLGQHTDQATGTKLAEKPTPAKPTATTRTQFSNPNFVSQKIKPQQTGGTEPSMPTNARSQHLGGITSPDHQKIETKHGVEGAKMPKTGGGAHGTKVEGTKNLPHKVGDAPKGTPYKEEKVSNRKTRVGHGVEAHEKFRKVEGVGEDPKVKLSESKQAEADTKSKKDKKIGNIQGQIHEAKRNEKIGKLGRGIKSKAQYTLIQSQLLRIQANP